ncbi:hypothetical protein OG320_26870 [Microbispora sp. NBC_01189]|nr:hypothetical protein OG320_26870 [Microbispora sp. NBC_01189]
MVNVSRPPPSWLSSNRKGLTALRTSLPLDDTESDMSYLFGKQLQEADVIALNKIDLLDAAEAAAVTADLRERYPTATVLGYSAKTGEGLEQLVSLWLGARATGVLTS